MFIALKTTSLLLVIHERQAEAVFRFDTTCRTRTDREMDKDGDFAFRDKIQFCVGWECIQLQVTKKPTKGGLNHRTVVVCNP